MALKAKISVAIPTLNSARHLEQLLPRLQEQALKPFEILVIDSSSDDHTIEVAKQHGARIHVIERSDFNHGGTRNLAASMLEGHVIVFLSHDVRPIGDEFIERLTAPVQDGRASASYARQRGGPHAIPTEEFLRQYNYPPEPQIRSEADIQRLGIHAFFFSNAAAAYDAASFREFGGFPSDTILSEDVILCARFLRAGHKIAYAADAMVEHTHNYSLGRQFRRYFDVGVAYREARDELRVGATLSKGRKYVREQLAWMWTNGHKRWIPFGVAESVAKFVGYQLGKHHTRLLMPLKRRLSMHPAFWR